MTTPLHSPRSLLLIEFALTAMMTGIIWFVQVVHYPLFLKIPREAFTSYEASHTLRTGWVVAPLMLAELGTALLLTFVAFGKHPSGPGADRLHLAALGCLLLIWASTFLVQVPLHGLLTGQADPGAMKSLVSTNWIRTLFWTLRMLLLLLLATRVEG